MSTKVGSIDLELLLNTKKYNKQLKNINKISSNTSDLVSSSLSKIGKAAIAAFSVKKIFDFGKECIDLGSNLAEVQNVVDVSFKSMNESVNEFAENAIEQFGLGQTVTKKYMGTFGAMSKAFGFAEKESFEMSKALTGLAGDVASFYNLSSDEAYTKLKSVFTGETETLKDLGVVMTQNALDQYALANGIGKTTAKMSEQEKVALRFKFVTEQLSLASGDFVRTQDNWANQTRVLTLRFNEFKATIGQGFINLFTPIVKSINLVLSKLQVLANAFKSFTEKLFGNAGGSESSNSISNLAADATEASDAVGGIGSKAKKTAKDLKALASFDTAQILKSDSSESSSDSSATAGGSGNFDFGDLSSVTKAADATDQKVNLLKNKFLELKEIFSKGFKISFDDTNFSGILESLKRIKESVKNIFLDNGIRSSMQQWADTCAYALGQAVGAVSRIGINIAEGLIGSIDNYLAQNKDRIINFISTIFDISSENVSLAGNLWQALGEISDIFSGETAKQIGSNFVSMLVNPFMSVIELFSKFSEDMRAVLFQPIIDNAENIKLAIENTLKPIQGITDTLSEAFTYIGDKCNEVYDTYIHPFMESLKTGISDTFGKFLDVYNEHVAPFLDYVSTGFKSLWDEHLKPFVDQVGEFLGSIMQGLTVLWENFLKPVIDWVIQNVIPAVVPVLKTIWDTISSVFGSIIDAIKGLIQTFKGIIDFVVGVFTGDWSKAWDGIKNIFSGVINSFKGIFDATINAISGQIKTMWSGFSNGAKVAWGAIKNVFGNVAGWFKNIFTNAWTAVKNVFTAGGKIFDGIKEGIANTFKNIVNKIIGGINKVVSIPFNAINKALGKLRDLSILGAQPFSWLPSISVPKIPLLANGGYFKANQPTLAIVGDNKRQSEIVTPENKMKEAFQDILNKNGLGTNREILDLLRTIIELIRNLGFDFNLFIDGYELDSRLEKIHKKKKFATNGGY